VTAADVQRVAEKYFTDDNRTVGLYYRKEGSAPEDPRLAGLDEAEKTQIRQVQTQLAGASAEQLDLLRQQLVQMEGMGSQVPAEQQDMFGLMLELMRERIAELEGEGQ